MDEDETAAGVRAEFAERLKAARAAYGRRVGDPEIGMRPFAIALGISGDRPEERYGHYEKARREPPLWILKAIRNLTGYSLDALVGGLPPGLPMDRSSLFSPAERLQIVRAFIERLRPDIDLPREMGVAAADWAAFEAGRKPVPRDLLLEIGTKFSVSYEFLLRGAREALPDGMQPWLAGGGSQKALPPDSTARGRGNARVLRNKRPPKADPRPGRPLPNK